jgi:transposase
MMGRHNRGQEQLFYSFCLDEVVPDDHLVRAIATVLDLSWVYAEVASYYPKIGRPSIDPVLMIRMLMVADEPEGEADQDRREGGEPRPLCRLPDG